MSRAITDEEKAQLEALEILRSGLISEKARLTDLGLSACKIDARLAEINLLIKPLRIKLNWQKSRDEHQAKVTGNTFSQLMKMCSLVTGLLRRGVALTPQELERFRTIATLVGHTKAVQWFKEHDAVQHDFS